MRSRACLRRFCALTFGLTLSYSAQAADSPPTVAPAHDSPASPLSENTEREIEAYCHYVQAVGQSSSALLFSPSLFATLGNVPTTAAEATDDLGGSRARLQLGLSFSPLRVYRGFVTNDIAKAECQRYAAEARTPPPVVFSLSERAPLLAKIRVLEGAVVRGRELRAKLAVQLETSLATIDEYRSLALQLNSLEQSLSEAAARLALVPNEPPRPSPAHAAARADSEDRLQEAQARLRRSQALEFELRAGYYRIFGQPQTLPAFAMATVEFSPGWLWQAPADARARAAHSAWLKARLAPPTLPPDVRAGLQHALQVTRERARVLGATLADLEARRAIVERVPGEQPRHYADVMGLQLASLLAEQAYLNTYAATLEQALASAPER